MKLTIPLLILHGGLTAFLLLATPVTSSASNSETTQITGFSLQDQFGDTHEYRFPKNKISVVLVADRRGSDQIPGWVKPIQSRFQQQIDIDGIADVSKVPGWLQDLVRGGIRRQLDYPILLDWQGSVCDQFHYKEGRVNLFILDQTGAVRRHINGAVTPDKLDQLTNQIESLLASEQKATGKTKKR
jgi:hypothetical protein